MPAYALRLGEVWETDRYDWKLPVTNGGKQTIEVKSFYASCGCVKVPPPAATIEVTQTIRLGAQQSRVRFVLASDGAPTEVAELTLHWHGCD